MPLFSPANPEMLPSALFLQVQGSAEKTEWGFSDLLLVVQTFVVVLQRW